MREIAVRRKVERGSDREEAEYVVERGKGQKAVTGLVGSGVLTSKEMTELP